LWEQQRGRRCCGEKRGEDVIQESKARASRRRRTWDVKARLLTIDTLDPLLARNICIRRVILSTITVKDFPGSPSSNTLGRK